MSHMQTAIVIGIGFAFVAWIIYELRHPGEGSSTI